MTVTSLVEFVAPRIGKKCLKNDPNLEQIFSYRELQNK